jgi:hypothetical protein
VASNIEIIEQKNSQPSVQSINTSKDSTTANISNIKQKSLYKNPKHISAPKKFN